MSVTKQCRDLQVGDSAYIECDSIKDSRYVTNRMSDTARLPAEMKEFKYSCQTYTAIALKDGHIIYINKVTRIK